MTLNLAAAPAYEGIDVPRRVVHVKLYRLLLGIADAVARHEAAAT